MASNKYTNTWLGYIKKLTNQNVGLQEFNVEAIEKMLLMNANFNSLLFHSIPMIYLLDYTTGKYIVMSQTSRFALGFEPTEWVKNGVDFTISLYNKDDLKLYNEKIFPERLQFIKGIPHDEQQNYVFSYNYRLRNSKGEDVNLLQRNCFIKSDANGLPYLSLGLVLNIDHFKKENPVVHVVEKINRDNFSSETVYKKIFYPHEENSLFSKREKEVLLWVADGLSSKEICNKLCISEGTVINHRKNMLLKSGAKNASELISYALTNNII